KRQGRHDALMAIRRTSLTVILVTGFSLASSCGGTAHSAKDASGPATTMPSTTSTSTTTVGQATTLAEGRRTPASQNEVSEEWDRLPADDGLGGDTLSHKSSGPLQWSVMVSVMEFVRDDPLESELRSRIAANLGAVPGVTSVQEEDREVWIVDGSPS